MTVLSICQNINLCNKSKKYLMHTSLNSKLHYIQIKNCSLHWGYTYQMVSIYLLPKQKDNECNFVLKTKQCLNMWLGTQNQIRSFHRTEGILNVMCWEYIRNMLKVKLQLFADHSLWQLQKHFFLQVVIAYGQQ